MVCWSVVRGLGALGGNDIDNDKFVADKKVLNSLTYEMIIVQERSIPREPFIYVYPVTFFKKIPKLRVSFLTLM